MGGEAGIGKTRLVAEALAGRRTVVGRCRQLAGAPVANGGFRDLLRDLRSRPREEPEPWRVRVDELLAIPPDAAGARTEIFDLVETLADTGELLAMVVEDLHWADGSLDLLLLLVRSVRVAGVLLVGKGMLAGEVAHSCADFLPHRAHPAERH